MKRNNESITAIRGQAWPLARDQRPPRARERLFPGMQPETAPSLTSNDRSVCGHGYHECATCSPTRTAPSSEAARKPAASEPAREGERAALAQPKAPAAQGPFAVGDVVRCVEPNARNGAPRLRLGDEYTVTEAIGTTGVSVRGSDGLVTIACPSAWFDLARRAADAQPECPEARKAGLPPGWFVNSDPADQETDLFSRFFKHPDHKREIFMEKRTGRWLQNCTGIGADTAAELLAKLERGHG